MPYNQSVVGWVYNEVVKGLNENKMLPRYVVMILDLNLIEAAQHGGLGGKMILEKLLNWLLKNITMAFDTCKEDAKHKRAGSFVPRRHPISSGMGQDGAKAFHQEFYKRIHFWPTHQVQCGFGYTDPKIS